MDRLTRAQLDGLFKQVKPVKTDHFSCRVLPLRTAAPLSGAKTTLSVAVVVGKKVSNKATVRNRLRRQVKGALQTLERKQGLAGQIVVVVAKRFELPFDELINELQQCCRR